MKKYIIAMGMLILTCTYNVQAQTASTNSSTNTTTSQSSQSTVATGTATNAGNAQNITFISPDTTTQSAQRGLDDIAIAAIHAATARDTTDVNAKTAKEIADINAKTALALASKDQVIKNTPSVAGPNLTTSNDTCMGSTSGSVNIAGLGIGGGTSWVDNNCKMLKNSRELWNMGMKAASLALMCTDAANREALELTGFECPQTTRARNQESAKAINVSVKSADQASNVDLSDPYIRSRLGLKPLDVASK